MKKMLIGLLMAMTTALSFAAETVEIVVPLAAGGSVADQYARTLQKFLIERFPSKEFIVVNKPGADGKVAYQYALQRSPGVVTIGVNSPGLITLPQVMSETQNYLMDDFEFLVPTHRSSFSLAVSAKSGINTFDDFIKIARTRPITCGTSNAVNGFVGRMVFAKYKLENAQMVNFKNTGEAIIQTINGNIDCVFDGLAVQAKFHRDGTMRLLAVSDKVIIQDVEGVDNIKRFSTLIPGSNQLFGWYGVQIPKSVPEGQRRELLNAIRAIINDDAFKEIAHNNLKLEPGNPPSDSTKFLEAQYNFYNQLRIELKIPRNN